MRILKKLIIAGLLLSPAFSNISFSQAFEDPVPVSVQGRFMPGFGAEAIVKVRYTVKADGSVDDVELIDYVSNQFVNNMLRDTVRGWTFTPGTVDGVPADFHNQEWLFALRIDPNAPATPPPFGPGGRGPANSDESTDATIAVTAAQEEIPLAMSEEIKEGIVEIYTLLAEQDQDKALKQLSRLMRKGYGTVFDYAIANELHANILMTRNEPFEALDAVNLATMAYQGPQGDRRYFLTDDALELALKRKFLLAMSVRQNQLAWNTYEELNNKFEVAEDDPIHEQASQVKALLDSPEPLQLITKIIDNQWTYHPVRRIFTITNLDGRLSEIEARCERRNLELKYQENVDWTLPDSLGDCELDFKGRDGTQFVVYEFSE